MKTYTPRRARKSTEEPLLETKGDAGKNLEACNGASDSLQRNSRNARQRSLRCRSNMQHFLRLVLAIIAAALFCAAYYYIKDCAELAQKIRHMPGGLFRMRPSATVPTAMLPPCSKTTGTLFSGVCVCDVGYMGADCTQVVPVGKKDGVEDAALPCSAVFEKHDSREQLRRVAVFDHSLSARSTPTWRKSASFILAKELAKRQNQVVFFTHNGADAWTQFSELEPEEGVQVVTFHTSVAADSPHSSLAYLALASRRFGVFQAAVFDITEPIDAAAVVAMRRLAQGTLCVPTRSVAFVRERESPELLESNGYGYEWHRAVDLADLRIFASQAVITDFASRMKTFGANKNNNQRAQLVLSEAGGYAPAVDSIEEMLETQRPQPPTFALKNTVKSLAIVVIDDIDSSVAELNATIASIADQSWPQQEVFILSYRDNRPRSALKVRALEALARHTPAWRIYLRPTKVSSHQSTQSPEDELAGAISSTHVLVMQSGFVLRPHTARVALSVLTRVRASVMYGTSDSGVALYSRTYLADCVRAGAASGVSERAARARALGYSAEAIDGGVLARFSA